MVYAWGRTSVMQLILGFGTPSLPCTEYAGWAVTAGIPVKFDTAHGRSRPEVGSTKCIDVYGSGRGFPALPYHREFSAKNTF